MKWLWGVPHTLDVPLCAFCKNNHGSVERIREKTFQQQHTFVKVTLWRICADFSRQHVGKKLV